MGRARCAAGGVVVVLVTLSSEGWEIGVVRAVGMRREASVRSCWEVVGLVMVVEGAVEEGGER